MNKELYSDVGIIILAGGSSNRFGENKLLQYINRKPILIFSLINFRNICPDKQIVVVCNSNYLKTYKDIINQYIPNNNFTFTEGGSKRQFSVISGMNMLPDTVNILAIHDAARPLASNTLLKKCIEACRVKNSGIAAKKIKDTIKYAYDNIVTKTLNREHLWSIETPQVFNYKEIKKAYNNIVEAGYEITDDSQAMELSNYPVYIVNNESPNIKLTDSVDLKLIELLLSS